MSVKATYVIDYSNPNGTFGRMLVQAVSHNEAREIVARDDKTVIRCDLVYGQ